MNLSHDSHGWKFPPHDHPVNAFFDRDALLEHLERGDWRNLVILGLWRAKMNAERFFASEPAAKSMAVLVWRYNGAVQLIQIGRRGGHKVLWTFRRAD